MKRKVRKCFFLLTILTVVILSVLFILPSMLFADTFTFNAIGDGNYPNVSVGTGQDVLFYFNVTGVDLNSITSATLSIEGFDVNYPSEVDEVWFNGHDLGHYVSKCRTWAFSNFSISPLWIVSGKNYGQVDVDITKWGLVYGV